MLIHDPKTNLTVADTDAVLIPAELAAGDGTELVSRVGTAVSRMILSASGWRTVFAADASEESASVEVAPELLVIAGLASSCFAAFLCEQTSGRPRIAVGIDTRPTGPAIAHAAVRVLLASGTDVDYLFITPSPEIVAYAASTEPIDGFLYVSASHNPIGHNGLKMGDRHGGVLGGEAAKRLIARFREASVDEARVADVAAVLARPADAAERGVLESFARVKADALSTYSRLCHEVVRGPGPYAEEAYTAFRRGVATAKPGIVGDLNGSARAASIDPDFLADSGCTLSFINDTPGEIAHQIVPEGAGLAPCCEELERLQSAGRPYILGYVPDNDGDRGNLVYYSESRGSAVALEAQEVFALSCVAELAWLVCTGELRYDEDDHPNRRVAIVVNGPTSLRVERIAEVFGAEVHRAEVGEANVVSRARQLREEGVLVRILGEGSNGGNITHPSAVRDPLHTIHAVLKLLYAPSTKHGPGPAQIWFSRRGIAATGRARGVEGLIASLPAFSTTSAFEKRAAMRIRSESHAALKKRFEKRLPDRFETLKPKLSAQLDVTSYRLVNYEGTTVRPGPANRTGDELGGLKVLLLDSHGRERGFVWMRGSGTEPVFRILADVEGAHPELEATLLEWLRSMVQEADAIPQG